MKVKLLATLRNITDCNEVEIEANDVQQVINELNEMYGEAMKAELLEKGKLDETITILINGRNIRYLEGLKTKLDPDDELTIFPRVAGG